MSTPECRPGFHLVKVPFRPGANHGFYNMAKRTPACLCSIESQQRALIPDPPSHPLAGLAAIRQGFGNEFAEQVVGYFIFGSPFTDDGSFSGSSMSMRLAENAMHEYQQQLSAFMIAKKKLVKP